MALLDLACWNPVHGVLAGYDMKELLDSNDVEQFLKSNFVANDCGRDEFVEVLKYLQCDSMISDQKKQKQCEGASHKRTRSACSLFATCL